MPGTVDDFIQRFSGQQTMDDKEAGHYVDRFASSAPGDQDFDHHALASGTSEYLGKLPEHEFTQAAQNAYSNATPTQQQGLVGTIMNALQSRGINVPSFAGMGQSGNTGQVDPNQYAQLANYARQQHPEVMQDVVKEQPWFVKAMGNPVVMGALGMVASRMMRSRTQAPLAAPEKETAVGGLLRKFL